MKRTEKVIFRSYKQRVGGSNPSTPTKTSLKCEAFLWVVDKYLTNTNVTNFQFVVSLML